MCEDIIKTHIKREKKINISILKYFNQETTTHYFYIINFIILRIYFANDLIFLLLLLDSYMNNLYIYTRKNLELFI